MSTAAGGDYVFGYARMSTNDIRRAKQLAHGDEAALAEIVAEKVAAQLAEISEYAAGEGWPVEQLFADNMISGSARYRGKVGQQPVKRDEMLAIVADRPGRRAILLSTEVSRFYRDTDESRELVRLARRSPVTVATVDDERYDLITVEGESGFEAVVSRAARESGTVSRRRRRKEARRAAEGGYWGTEPFGYHKVYEQDLETGDRYYTNRLVLCDENCPGLNNCMAARIAADTDDNATLEAGSQGGEAELIRAAAEHVATGAYTLAAVVREWHALGITTRSGAMWSQPMVRALLLNKRLSGIRVHRAGDKWGRASRTSAGTEYRGDWPAILDDDAAMALRGVLLDPERSQYLLPGGGGRGVRKHLLAGLAVCGSCGATMRGHPRPGGKRAYKCPPVPEGCGKCSRTTAIADGWVIEHIIRWTAPGGPYAAYAANERASHEAGQVTRSAELAEIAAADEKAARTIAGYQARLDDGIGDPAALDAVLGSIARIGKARDQRAARAAQLQAGVPPAPVKAEDHEGIKVLLLDTGGDIAERAELVRRFVERVIIAPPGQGTRGLFDPATVRVIPGAWAHGLEPAGLAVAPPDGTRTERYRDVALGFLAAHPGATAKDLAAASGRSHSFACTELAKLQEAGRVTAVKQGRAQYWTLAG